MKSLPFSKIRFIVIFAALLLLASGIGYRLGERRASLKISPDKKIILHLDQPENLKIDFGVFWDAWAVLERLYIDKSALDAQKMVWGAITGMVNSLGDPYTTFLPPKENQEFKEDLGGQFEGIGAQLGLKDNRIVVVAPLKGMPAEAAGIKAGDYIFKVNNEETIGWTINQAVTKIRGPRGTKVKLAIYHENSTKAEEIEIQREKIVVPSVDYWIKPIGEVKEISGLANSNLKNSAAKVAYLGLSRFGDRTSEEWLVAVRAISQASKDQEIKGLVFDLRNNPGGYLDGSVFIASEFLKSGIIVTQVNSDGSSQSYKVSRKGNLLDIPLVVLINKGSASASEIVAGAIRDYQRGSLVGETSFGKGSVQSPQELSGGSSLHVTTGKWLLPKGESIAKAGIKPEIEVKLTDGTTATQDAQLAKAIELLLR